MIRLIRFLITGDWHLHEWEPHGDITRDFWREGEALPYKVCQPCRCKHCGKIKSFKL